LIAPYGVDILEKGSRKWDTDAPLNVQREHKEHLTCLSYQHFPIQREETLHCYEEQLCFVKVAAVFMSLAEPGQLPWGSFRLQDSGCSKKLTDGLSVLCRSGYGFTQGGIIVQVRKKLFSRG
jgi:hypothetical protein